ncbi:DivIVA domain-containing protein [Corynebacterium auriscanis]|uniref:DivIVA domain-containing protein n=1 Tax=Corynebacterium auriscanis TaxID=99807 RepID=UPI002246DB6B|nr:DivIVA domain-containing protein [Corynebacterium auriscanis]MCX2162423.1 DivIVA domain-containing protein [Corynebacterium auriscanis]
MFWLLSFAGGVLVAALLTFLLGNVFGRGEELPDVKKGPASQEHWRNLTQAPVTAASVTKVQFSLGLRGYRQDEVDAYLENVHARLAELENAARTDNQSSPHAPLKEEN